MAIHRFVCSCGDVVEDTTTKGVHICPSCKEEMALDCRVAIHGNYKHPVHSNSLAIHPSQRAEHAKLFPNIRLDNQCRPIFEKFIDHENYLKETGFQKLPQKIRRSSAVDITPKN